MVLLDKFKLVKSIGFIHLKGSRKMVWTIPMITLSPDLTKAVHYEFKNMFPDPDNKLTLGNMVMNSVKSKQYQLFSTLPKFSGDSEHFSYTFTDTSFISVEGSDKNSPLTRSIKVIDNVEYGPYDVIMDDFIFSPNSKNWAFSAKIIPGRQASAAFSAMIGGIPIVHHESSDEKHFVILNGQKQKEYPVIAYRPIFSPDGGKLAYVAGVGKLNPSGGVTTGFGSVTPEYEKWFREQKYKNLKFIAVINGIESKEYDLIEWIAFSPDGNHYAHNAKIKGKHYIVVDGLESSEFHDGISMVSFSPNGKLYYVVHDKTNGKLAVVVDGVVNKSYDGIGNVSFRFSREGDHFAYTAQENNKWCVVLDGKESNFYDTIERGSPVFSPNGNRIAYSAMEDNKCFLVLDGQEGKHYDIATSPVFSPNSKRIAYSVSNDNVVFAVIDNIEQKQFEMVYEYFFFSPNSEHVAYVIEYKKPERDKWIQKSNYYGIVIDKTEGEIFNSIILPPYGNLMWKSNESFYYGATRWIEKEIFIYKVEDSISSSKH